MLNETFSVIFKHRASSKSISKWIRDKNEGWTEECLMWFYPHFLGWLKNEGIFRSTTYLSWDSSHQKMKMMKGWDHPHGQPKVFLVLYERCLSCKAKSFTTRRAKNQRLENSNPVVGTFCLQLRTTTAHYVKSPIFVQEVDLARIYLELLISVKFNPT